MAAAPELINPNPIIHARKARLHKVRYWVCSCPADPYPLL